MKRIGLMMVVVVSFFAVHAQTTESRTKMAELVRENFILADSQYRYMMTQIPVDKMPQSYDEKNKKVLANDITWWCSGFYPGSLWYIYEQTKDETIKKQAETALDVIAPNQTYTGNHDLGFMMFCSFGNAYRLTQNEKYKNIIFRSAETLSARYRPSIKAIQSWNSNVYFKCPVIIDNMLNIEMLYWVSNQGGEAKFKDIAIAHANTTLKNHFRPDYSSYHVVDYDIKTGAVIRKATWQGASDNSSWARGQAWGLYGYTMMYRFTKDKIYLKQACNIAKYILHHPNLPADKIPYWDFDAPFIPKAKRDASAAAVMASALLELGQYCSKEQSKEFVSAAETILQSLSSDAYRSKYKESGGFLLKHSTGGMPLNSEIDVPIIYADYYFLEALKRYKDWYLQNT